MVIMENDGGSTTIPSIPIETTTIATNSKTTPMKSSIKTSRKSPRLKKTIAQQTKPVDLCIIYVGVKPLSLVKAKAMKPNANRKPVLTKIIGLIAHERKKH